MNSIGYQKNIDCYGCSFEAINNQSKINYLMNLLCQEINAQILETGVHLFENQGISAYAIISTSHIGIHTWPEYQYAAIDIFSCKGEIPNTVINIIKNMFQAEEVKAHDVERGQSISNYI